MDKKKLSPRLYDGGGNLSKRWFVFFYVDGKRVQKYGNINQFNTDNERRKAAQIIIDSLLAVTPPTCSIYKDAFEWIESKKPTWRLKTYQTLKSKIVVFFRWLKNKPLDPVAVNDFFMYLDSKGTHPTTRNSYKRYLTQLNKEVWKVPNLLDNVRKVAAVATPAKYFTQSQIKLLKKEFINRNIDLWRFVQFMFYCFIRPNELRLMRIEDVVLEDGVVLVRGNISKNKKEQFVQIPNSFLIDLQTIIQDREPNEYIFGNGSQPRKKDFYSRKHQEILKELGFDTERYKLYSWKHTGAVMCAKNGVNMKDLQIQLRHHSLDQVNEYLRQMGVQDLKELANKFPTL